MKTFPKLTIPLIFTNLMVLASCIFTVPNVINNVQKREELNNILNGNTRLNFEVQDHDLQRLKNQVSDLRLRLNGEEQIRDGLLRRIHGLGLNHVGLNERGEINLSQDDIECFRAMDQLIVIDQIELNRRRVNEIEREIINFIVANPGVIDGIIGRFF